VEEFKQKFFKDRQIYLPRTNLGRHQSRIFLLISLRRQSFLSSFLKEKEIMLLVRITFHILFN